VLSSVVTLPVSAVKLVSVATPARAVSAAVIRVVKFVILVLAVEMLLVCVVLTVSAAVILLVKLVMFVSAVPTLVVRAVRALPLVDVVDKAVTRPDSMLAIRAVTLPNVVEVGLET
jgi:hypothetical protein